VQRKPQGSVLVEDLYSDAGGLGVELLVQRYHPNSALTGIARLPTEAFVIAPRRLVEIADDGALYAMVPAKEGTTIYRVELGQTYRSRISDQVDLPQVMPGAAESSGIVGDAMPSQIAATPAGAGTSAINIAAITSSFNRRIVRERANTMVSTTWTWRDKYNSFNSESNTEQTSWDWDGTITAANRRKPIQLMNATDGKNFTGIPYSWGALTVPIRTVMWAVGQIGMGRLQNTPAMARRSGISSPLAQPELVAHRLVMYTVLQASTARALSM
jgi:hypothetical protein